MRERSKNIEATYSEMLKDAMKVNSSLSSTSPLSPPNQNKQQSVSGSLNDKFSFHLANHNRPIADSIRDAKVLVSNMILGLRTILWCLSNYKLVRNLGQTSARKLKQEIILENA